MATIIDTATALHARPLEQWAQAEREYLANQRRVPDRYEMLCEQLAQVGLRKGDAIVQRIRSLFHTGMGGIKWGDAQIRVFNALLASCLPLIYGATWPEEKTRVLREWHLEREQMFNLLSLARRNGKTYSTSGAAAAIFLCVPNVKILVFSTCKRTSQMMMEAIMDRLNNAFDSGTHVSKRDYTVITKNMERIVLKGPDGTLRTLECLPGSVRVSGFVCVCVWWCAGRQKKQTVRRFCVWLTNPSLNMLRKSTVNIYHRFTRPFGVFLIVLYILLLLYWIGFVVWWETTRPPSEPHGTIIRAFLTQTLSLAALLYGMRAPHLVWRDFFGVMLLLAHGLAGNAYNCLHVYIQLPYETDRLGWALLNVVLIGPLLMTVMTMIWSIYHYVGTRQHFRAMGKK